MGFSAQEVPARLRFKPFRLFGTLPRREDLQKARNDRLSLGAQDGEVANDLLAIAARSQEAVPVECFQSPGFIDKGPMWFAFSQLLANITAGEVVSRREKEYANMLAHKLQNV
jgi:hypothetical protein